MNAWGFIPARGGSKSIPLKNLLSLRGRPLIEYGIRAGLACKQLKRLVCSSDHEEILQTARDLGVETDLRTEELSGDDSPVTSVARDFLLRQSEIPEFLILIQPTSPFLLPEHIDSLIDRLERHPELNSAHTVTLCSHNAHAWNQRFVDEHGQIEFLFAEERKQAYNKQRKPKLHIFGNLIGARSTALLQSDGFYAEPAAGISIPSAYGFDLDSPQDINLAEALLSSGEITLPHMED